MMVLIAFLSGMAVTTASLFVPQARNTRSSIDEFQAFQSTLASLPTQRTKKQRKVAS